MSVFTLLYSLCKRTPKDLALVDEDGSWTYDRYYKRAENIARSLLYMGASVRSRVALLMTNNKDAAACQVGIGAIGAICVLLNTRFKAPEIEKILEDSKASILIMQEGFKTTNYICQLKDILANNKYLKNVIVLPGSEGRGKEYIKYDDFLSMGQDMDDLKFRHQMSLVKEQSECLAIYTSGTTGDPKGVLLTHRNLISSAVGWKTYLNLRAGVRASLFTPMFHAAGAVNGVVGGIVSGCCMVMMQRFETEQSLSRIRTENVNVYLGVPTMLSLQLQSREFRKERLPSLTRVVTGGSRVDPELVIDVRERLLCEVQIVYGLSEANISTMTRAGDADSKKFSTIGKPCLNYRVCILDEHGIKVPAGEVGEIAIMGDHVFKGYLDRYKDTRNSFHSGWFLSGDLGVEDDQGYISYFDRKKDIYIRGGENVYPSEIEKVLQRCPGVELVAVIGVPHKILGEVGSAFVVRQSGSKLTAEDIKKYLKVHLADYKIPEHFLFRDSLPMTPFGKIQKAELVRQVRR